MACPKLLLPLPVPMSTPRLSEMSPNLVDTQFHVPMYDVQRAFSNYHGNSAEMTMAHPLILRGQDLAGLPLTLLTPPIPMGRVKPMLWRIFPHM
jgi:hypothetical protein